MSTAQDLATEDAPTIPVDRVRRFVHMCHFRAGSPLDDADLDEAVQEALVAAWRSAGSFRGTGTFDSWLYSVARNSLLHVMRRERRRRVYVTGTEAEHERADEGRGPATAADTALERLVLGSVAQSGTTCSRIVIERDVHGESFVEIARLLGLSETAVKARYYRGLPGIRRRLRRTWADWVGERRT